MIFLYKNLYTLNREYEKIYKQLTISELDKHIA
jgi:hypothetical protein